MPGYANPDAIVSTEWVAANLDNTERVRLVESNEDLLLYGTGHIPNAVHIDWVNDLQDQIVRDYVGKHAFAELCGRHGIREDTTVVFYGDKSNWWACYAFWVFKLFGHRDCRVMDGGRTKWKQENRTVTREVPAFEPTDYPVRDPDPSIRAFRDEVLEHMRAHRPMVDVRSPEEYSGERIHMPEYPQEGAMRGGHIPGARSVPWSRAVQGDGTFRPRHELEALYLEENDLDPHEETIAYCRIGERSSHTWFVLKYLLGFDDVKNYDGSWSEWGNLVGVPIEKSREPGEVPV